MLRRLLRNPHRSALAIAALVALVAGIGWTLTYERIAPAFVGILAFAVLSTVAHLLEGDS